MSSDLGLNVVRGWNLSHQ